MNVTIRETWTIEATVGTPGVSENTFQWAIIDRSKAPTAEDAITYAGARDWRYTGGKHYQSQTDVFAYKSYALDKDVDTQGDGAPGSCGAPCFDTMEEALDALDS